MQRHINDSLSLLLSCGSDYTKMKDDKAVSLTKKMRANTNTPFAIAKSSKSMNPLREIHDNNAKQRPVYVQYAAFTQRKRAKKQISSEEEKETEQIMTPQVTKTVRFNLRDKQSYKSAIKLRAKDHAKLWYSSKELKNFQRQTRADQTSHPLYATWSSNLHRVYHSFCTVGNASEIMAILDATPNVFHPTGVGMERRAVPYINEDSHNRRQQLYLHVQRCQEEVIPDPLKRSEMIREGSRAISKPSRLYARHIAYTSSVSGS